MQCEWPRAPERGGALSVLYTGRSAGRHFFFVIGIVKARPLFLLLIPPDQFLALAPGLPVGTRGGAIVDNAAVVGPGESPAVTKQVLRVAFERAIAIRFGIDAAVDPGTTCRGTIVLEVLNMLKLRSVANVVAVDLFNYR